MYRAVDSRTSNPRVDFVVLCTSIKLSWGDFTRLS